ncbi:DASH family cryptochrome [Bdellovibrio sp. HCB209]|uniref:DASH family cryptochrome n=1 Tax=Bdellovibrio sp. HCB209 TaxID=3394354 RepID=UPI0039B6CF9B
MRALYWFRNDLRLHDNEALTWLCEHAQDALFVYSYPLNFSRAGKFRRKFLLETLANLEKELADRGHDLVITYSHPEEVLTHLVHKYKIDTLVYTEEYTPEEIREERQVLSRLVIDRIVAIDQRTLLKKSVLPFPLLDLPQNLAEFQVLVDKKIPAKVLPIPLMWPEPITPDEFELDLNRELRMFTTPSRFSGGEIQALTRLKEFIWDKDLLRSFKDPRAELMQFDDSSKFSPWLSNGSLSPRVIYWEVKNYETERTANDSTNWMLMDLLRRDYFKYYALKMGPFLFQADTAPEHQSFVNDQLQTELFKSWKAGSTGRDPIDGNMKELNETGFISYKGRQDVANYLIETLSLDWRWGARYFEEMLIDFDAASNWGNWNYVAGINETKSPQESQKRSSQTYPRSLL